MSDGAGDACRGGEGVSSVPFWGQTVGFNLFHQDFHSHLTRSEVVGYLGGRWDTNTQCR